MLVIGNFWSILEDKEDFDSGIRPKLSRKTSKELKQRSMEQTWVHMSDARPNEIKYL